jgi:hypothetical protein
MLPIDWPKIIEEIADRLGEEDPVCPGQRIPCSGRPLAAQLSQPRSTLQGWIDGSEPKHADGEALLDRWSQLTGKARIFAPREQRSLSAAKL